MPRRQIDVSRSVSNRFAAEMSASDSSDPDANISNRFAAEMSASDYSDPDANGIPRVRAESAPRLLEVEDVANYLGMRTDWVYREARAGRLPHIRLGRTVRFRRESIDAWLASRERMVSSRRRP